jgi:hypothetical protein
MEAVEFSGDKKPTPFPSLFLEGKREGLNGNFREPIVAVPSSG